MTENSSYKLGGLCAVVTGIFYVLIGITYLLLPPEQKAAPDPFQSLTSFAQNHTFAVLIYWEFALGAIFAIAAVFSISEVIKPINREWIRWISSLAYIGLFVTVISYFRGLAVQAKVADAFVAGDASTKAAIAAAGEFGWFDLDPHGWMKYGFLGIWVLVVSILALRKNGFPKTLSYVGILTTIFYFFVVAGFTLEIEILVTIGAGLGGVITAPIWFIWMGRILLRKNTD